MSAIAVTPTFSNAACASARAASRSRAVGTGTCLPTSSRRCVDKYAAWLATGNFDATARWCFARGCYACDLHRAAIRPARMAIDAFQPNWTVGDNRIKVGGIGETAQPPFFLIPAAPDDPAPVGVLIGIGFQSQPEPLRGNSSPTGPASVPESPAP